MQKKFLVILIIPLLLTGCGSRKLFRESYAGENGVFYFLGDIFVPETVMNTYRMRDFISGSYFSDFKKRQGDVKTIDEMYDYAMWITDNDIPQSLFIISLSTLPYKRTPAKLPVLNIDLMFYFSFETDEKFKRRFENLPSHFLIDSPKNNFGDKDKLPHYFGSAFLSNSSDAKFVPKYIGDMIEVGEAFFSLEGYYDERDRQTNSNGADFGLALLKYPSAKPSQFLNGMKK